MDDTGGGRGPAAGMMDHRLCDGHNAGKDCNVSTRYLIRSVADVCKKIPFSLSLIFTTSECKAGAITVYCFCPQSQSHARRGPPELSKCKYGNYSRNVDSVSSLSATNTLRPLQACPRLSSPLSLRPLSLSLSKSLSCSVTLAQ